MSLDSTTHDKLMKFLRQTLSAETPKGLVRIMSLKFYGKAAARDEEIQGFTVRPPTGIKLLKDINTLAEEIGEAMMEQAEGVGGIVKFRLFAYAENSGPKAVASAVFRIYAPEEEETDADGMPVVSEEIGTSKGMLAQTQRHLETMHRQFAGAIADMQRNLRYENDELRRHNTIMMGKFVDVVGVVEKLMTQEATRKAIERSAEVKAQQLTRLGDKLAVLLPAVINKVLGAPIMPGQSNPELEAVKSLFETLSQEQFMRIMQTLNEAQRAPVIQFYEMLMKEQEEKQLKTAGELSSALPSTQKQMTSGS